MRNVSFIVSGIVVIVAAFFEASTREAQEPKAGASPNKVVMKSLSFDPKKLELHVGDSVIWSNEARTSHTATSDDDGKTFDTGAVDPGKSSKPIKFEKEGEFKYHCRVHGRTMSGTVIVSPAEKP